MTFVRNTAYPGDLVFTQRGTLGQVGIIPREARFERYIISQSQMKLTVDAQLADPRFVYYFFRLPATVQSVINHAATSGVPHINLGTLKDFNITLPDLTAQQRIATVLSAYDELMENNRRRMALLEKAARLLYQEWFVRLRFPGHEHTPITHGLPQGWERRTIGDFIEEGQVHLQTGPFGTQLKASDYVEEGVPVINVRNIGYGNLRADKLEFLPDEVAERLSVHTLREGDIVFGRKGAVDRHLLVTTAQQGWMQGSDCIRLRSFSDAVCPVLLTFAFRQASHHDWMLRQCGNKATMASLNHDVISRIPLLVPVKPIIQEFHSFAADCLAQIANLSLQNQKLRAARDLLLPRLMSGEIAV